MQCFSPLVFSFYFTLKTLSFGRLQVNQIQEVDYKARHCGENNYIDTLLTVSRSS